MLPSASIHENEPDGENLQTPLMSPAKMHESTHTNQYNSRKYGNSFQEKCCALSCCLLGVILCCPLCPLYNVWEYRKLKQKQAKAEENGYEFEISSTYEAIQKMSLVFCLIVIIWFIVSIMLCLLDNWCSVIT